MNTKHPKGLPVLFFSEMWERYGFYVAQGLLVLYMTQVIGFTDTQAYSITGAFTALAYILPMLGGFMADQVLGFRRAIILGNVLMAVGYALLVMPNPKLLYVGLAFIVVGTGFFKPNVSSLLGALYQPNDFRRDSGFTIFYVGVNLGVILATSSTGYIKDWLGWHASFGAAALGLIIGLITFLVGKKRLDQLGFPPAKELPTAAFIKILRHPLGTVVTVVFMLCAAALLFKYNQIATLIFWLGIIVVGIGLIIVAFRYPQEERNKLLALFMLIAAAVIFWAIFFQVFFSVNLFIDRNVQHNFGAIHIPTVMFIALESVFIFLLGPVVARFWQRASQAKRNPSQPTKFGLAMLFISMGFCCLYLSSIFINSVSGLANPLWIVAAYLLITLGELLLSPIGLATVTILSPANLAGMMMGVWFISLGLGGNLAGVIAKIASVPETIKDPHLTAPYYAHAFLQYAVLGSIACVIVLLIAPLIRKLANLPKGA